MTNFISKTLHISNDSLRTLYQQRNLSHPTDGNRNVLSVSICIILLLMMVTALFHVEYSSIYPNVHSSYPTGYLTRHVMGIFVIMLFLFIDGSPETLGLGMFLGYESVARAIDYQWLSVPYPIAVQHYLFQMGDIARIFFAIQLARIGPKQLWPWIKYGSAISVPYALAMEFSPYFVDQVSTDIRIFRDVIGGFFGAMVCGRVAFAIWKENLPLRIIALTIATIAFLESPVNLLWDISQHGHISELTRVSLGFYRTLSYYLFALSAFINISTIEHRVRALSSAKAEQRLQGIREEQRVYEAIAKTTQMLAHDVRKPFSLFKAYFDTLSAAKNKDESSKIMHNMLIDVQRSLKNVDQLIADIMDIGRDIPNYKHPVQLDHLIASSLDQVFRVSANTRITFHYHLKHKGSILANEIQLQRVLSNILGNAEQAIQGQAESITFTTDSQLIEGREYIYFEIHNTGSTISSEDLPNIFDAFFTKGKRHGTGLGLAIVKKIITEHGGEITASSTEEDGTSFKIILPAIFSGEKITPKRLPKTSAELQLTAFSNMMKTNVGNEPQESQFNRLPVTSMQPAKPTMTVLIADDELAYATAVEANIRPYLPHAKIIICRSPEEALDQIHLFNPDLLICDYHFEHSEKTGVDVILAFKQMKPYGHAILHTNHLENREQLRNAKGAINIVLAKPLSHSDFENYITNHYNTSPADLISPNHEIILIDDEAIFVDSALQQLEGYKVHVFEYPSQLDQIIARDSSFMKRIDTVIVDHYFGANEITGLEYAEQLRVKFGPVLNIILHTNQSTGHPFMSPSPINGIAIKGQNNLLGQLKRRKSA